MLKFERVIFKNEVGEEVREVLNASIDGEMVASVRRAAYGDDLEMNFVPDLSDEDIIAVISYAKDVL